MGMISIPVTRDTKRRKRKREGKEGVAEQTTLCFSQIWLGTVETRSGAIFHPEGCQVQNMLNATDAINRQLVQQSQ